MALFQSTILSKYCALLDEAAVNAAYTRFCSFFHDSERQKAINSIKEEEFQDGFLRELFVNVLGYTLKPDPGYNLVREKKDVNDSKKADGAILKDGQVIGVIELKDQKTLDLQKVERQAFGYKNQHEIATYVIISNFRKLRFYIDNAVEHIEWDLFTLTRQEFSVLWLCLHYDNVARHLPKTVKNESVSTEEQITNKLYKDYIDFKRELFLDILAHNTTETGEHSTPEWKILLFKKTQKLLDRLLFIFFAEDGGLLPPNSMVRIIDQWQQLIEMDEDIRLYSRLRKYFGYMNTGHKGKTEDIFAYNGGLFKPDDVLDGLFVSDDVLARHTRRLSEYDYASEVDVNILGHIFENSLTEIEEVTAQLQQGETPTVSKRKRDGVFYTPQYITKYIVDNTVGRLCHDKKAELGIVESDYFADANRTMKTKRAMMERLEAYREWLLGLTICDPACGSGAFLNAALRFLMDEHQLIDEMQAELTDSQIIFPDVENAILENNLFGVDINEESVEIARLSLWLRTAKPYRKLSTLNENIKCGNSLISDPAVAGDKAFDWQAEFPQVFAKGGFDIVIGNPPYVNAIELRRTYTTEQYNFLRSNYSTAQGTVDLYIYFFEKGLCLLNSHGLLSYITPNRYLSASYGTGIRKYILKNNAFYQLIDYSDKKVFEDASTYPVITMLQKEKVERDVLCGKFDEETHELISRTYPSNQLDILDDSILGFLLNEKIGITQMVINQSSSLSSIGEINATSTAKEADEYAPLITESSESGFRLINTGTIDPYYTTWGTTKMTKQGKQYLNPYLPVGSDVISTNRYNLYGKPKIIISKIGLRCEAFWDKEGLYASIDTNCIHDFSDTVLPEYVLCWLNSRLYNYTFECLFDGLRMSGGYLLYSAPNLKNTYIKIVPLADQQPFVELADKMQALTESLQQKRSRFARRLVDNLHVGKVSVALSFFDRLSFTDFLQELKKQKVKLTLSQQDEWEAYHQQCAAECRQLREQLATTDQEINERIYSLYGLTPAEADTVNGSC